MQTDAMLLEGLNFLEGLHVLHAKTSALGAFRDITLFVGTLAVVRPRLRGASETSASDNRKMDRHANVKTQNRQGDEETVHAPLLSRYPELWLTPVDAGGCASYLTSEFRSTLRLVGRLANLVGRTGAYLSCFVLHGGQKRRNAARYIQEQAAPLSRRTAQGARCLLGHADLRTPWSRHGHTVADQAPEADEADADRGALGDS